MKTTTNAVLWQERLEINGADYLATKINPDCEGVTAQVRLEKAGGEVYDLATMEDGRCDCSCPDYVFRAEQRGDVCKHVRACLANGLLKPVPDPEREAELVFQVVTYGGNTRDEYQRIERRHGKRYADVVMGRLDELVGRMDRELDAALEWYDVDDGERWVLAREDVT